MPIRGFFQPRPFPALNRIILRGGLGGNGITVEGAVLEGRTSVEEAMVRDWIRGTPGSWRSSREDTGKREGEFSHR